MAFASISYMNTTLDSEILILEFSSAVTVKSERVLDMVAITHLPFCPGVISRKT